MPSLSILLPTYNGARFLAEQLDSIRAQSFADWRLLVCDDGSTDGTVALLERHAADARIRIVPSRGNLGQKRRLRELFAHADTELVAVSDQDDVWAPDKLRLLVDALGEADLAFGSSCLIDGEGRDLGRTLLDSFRPPLAPDDRLIYLFRPVVSAHAMVARRRLFEGAALSRARPFDWLQSLEAVFARGIVHVPEARTFHRIHGGNQMNGALGKARGAVNPLSPGQVRRQLAEVAARRLAVLGHLEHLAFSTLPAEDVATRFAAAHEACRRAWYDGARPVDWGGSALRTRLETLLRPLAGSERDWRRTERALLSITQAGAHPGQLLRRLRRARD